MRILIVDDCQLTLDSIGNMLRGIGLTIFLESSVDNVLEIDHDLIILDLYMPNKSGLDICIQLKSNEDTRDIPVVMLSSSHESIDKINCYNVGAIDYIEKPVSREALVNTINAYTSIGVMVKTSKQIQREITDGVTEEKDSRNSL